MALKQQEDEWGTLDSKARYEGTGGWSDGRLGQAYDLIASIAQSLPNGSTEAGCLSDALKAVELADTYIEKRNAEENGLG